MVDRKEIVRTLSAKKIPFVLTGTHGISGWTGRVRATYDVDILVKAGRNYARAVDAFDKTLQLDPTFGPAHGFLACAYAGAGRKREALEQVAQLKDEGDGEHMALRAWVLWISGENEAAAKLAREIIDRSSRSPIRPGILAALYWLVGDRDRAFSLLDQAYVERDWTMRELKVNPMFDPMRGDPRFQKLCEEKQQ